MEKRCDKNGILPWYMQEMVQKLTWQHLNTSQRPGFVSSADLGHYIGDATMPLHTSLSMTDSKPIKKEYMHSGNHNYLSSSEMNIIFMWHLHIISQILMGNMDDRKVTTLDSVLQTEKIT
jgi:hypothetical protein